MRIITGRKIAFNKKHKSSKSVSGRRILSSVIASEEARVEQTHLRDEA